MSEALRLAEALDRSLGYDLDQAAAELRRLHAENERLREALRELLPMAEYSVCHPERDYRILDARAILK